MSFLLKHAMNTEGLFAVIKRDDLAALIPLVQQSVIGDACIHAPVDTPGGYLSPIQYAAAAGARECIIWMVGRNVKAASKSRTLIARASLLQLIAGSHDTFSLMYACARLMPKTVNYKEDGINCAMDIAIMWSHYASARALVACGARTFHSPVYTYRAAQDIVEAQQRGREAAALVYGLLRTRVRVPHDMAILVAQHVYATRCYAEWK